MRRGAALALLVLAACGDNGGDAVDATPADAFAPPDAIECAPNAAAAVWTQVDLPFGTLLELDGAGTACEQVIAALPQLATIESAEGLLSTPHDTRCDDFDGSVQVTLFSLPAIDGTPIVHGEWSVFFFVWVPTGEVFASGSFLDIEDLPPPSCLGELGLRLQLPGHDVHYIELANCFQTGGGDYTITVGDAYTMGDAVLWVDQTEFPSATIHRARWVEVRLLPSHVTEPIRFSDFMCCDGENLVDCVGTIVLADGFTGDILEQARLCEPTCKP
jgi:hypothetical protein